MAASMIGGERANDVRLRVLEVLRRYGWNATSFQILEPGFAYWFGEPDACVAYVDTGRAWVAAGAPVAADEKLVAVARAFVRAARAARRRAVFFATERRFADADGFDSVLIGEQPLWDPAEWPRTLETVRSLREQLRRARAKGVVVSKLSPAVLADEQSAERRALDVLIERWSGMKAMPPMGFLVRVYPYSFPEERHVYVAKQDDRLVGFAGVVPIYARNGRFIEDLLRGPDAPNGTSELLVDAAMRDAAVEGVGYVTLGLAPLAGAVPFGLRLAGRWSAALYDFAGLAAFKAKFRPRQWAPIYLSYPEERSMHVAVYDSLSAFSQRGLLRYGLDALLRGPTIVVRMLALLLVPWTLLLATADGARWFPAAWVQWFWVVFDVVVCGGLIVLSVRWRAWLAAVLFTLVSADAVTTFVEAALFLLGRRPSAFELVVAAVAVAGPVLASVVLYNARRRTARAAGRGEEL
ncbi:MAG TPA: phosphatidylglycerol lysyltransferase domain-containing protein, partial [Polyangiaceae bacterium]|nr:phosphatidylglycerol lysyltransferase domain-containing protein [Polyangiaceae bacterium]